MRGQQRVSCGEIQDGKAANASSYNRFPGYAEKPDCRSFVVKTLKRFIAELRG